MKRFICVLVLIFIIFQIMSLNENFANSINKLEWESIKTLPINKNNIDTSEPLYCFENYCLYFKDNVYSLFDKSTFLTHSKYNADTKECDFVYLKTILQLYPKNIKNVCIFGFGIGGLPLALSKNSNIERIDCVEIDVRMFELFKTINPNPPEKIHYYLNDVNDFIKESESKYDMIVDDTYGAEKVIVDYKLVKQMLNPNGILFINLIKHELAINLVEKLKKIFSNVSLQPVNYNWLITCNY
jgi:hypothetical protein